MRDGCGERTLVLERVELRGLVHDRDVQAGGLSENLGKAVGGREQFAPRGASEKTGKGFNA